MDLFAWEMVAPVATGLLCALLIYLKASSWGGAREAEADARHPREAPGPVPEEWDPFVDGSSQEKRQALRRLGNRIRAQVAEADDKAVPIEAWVVDRSLGGLGIECDRKFPVGTLIRAKAVQSSAWMPWVELRVCNSRELSRGWFLGCQFEKLPPSAVLWQFG